mmetsp:Transcript_49177/g.130197  ORF Transcript_49177/g.130197 Transcript_49177/m.130197 type:complete len:249 (-) Transcript_49177:101-847(-)
MTPALIELNPSDELPFVISTHERSLLSKGINRPKSVVKIKNISRSVVAFRMQANAPAVYLVNPVRGTLAPGAQQEVTLTVRSSRFDSDKNRFRVQTAVVRRNVDVPEHVWTHLLAGEVPHHDLRVVVRSGEERRNCCLFLAGLLAHFTCCTRDAPTMEKLYNSERSKKAARAKRKSVPEAQAQEAEEARVAAEQSHRLLVSEVSGSQSSCEPSQKFLNLVLTKYTCSCPPCSAKDDEVVLTESCKSIS